MSPLLEGYLEEELNPSDLQGVESHLHTCKLCKEAIEQIQYRYTEKNTPSVTQKEWFIRWQKIAKRIQPDILRSRRSFAKRLKIYWAGLAAACILFAFSVSNYRKTDSGSEPALDSGEISVEVIDVRETDLVPICYYSEESNLTVIWLASEDL